MTLASLRVGYIQKEFEGARTIRILAKRRNRTSAPEPMMSEALDVFQEGRRKLEPMAMRIPSQQSVVLSAEAGRRSTT